MARFQRIFTYLARRDSTSESGQVLIMFVLLLPVLLGMTALAIDLGSYSANRRDLQNDADAIALAAAQELPNSSAAESAAEEWAELNGIDPSLMTVSITGISGSGARKVTVSIAREHPFTFAGVLGISNSEVGARAVAVKTSYGGGGNVVPWAVRESIVDASGNGQLITMKYDANNVNNGNFGAIRIDGSGSNVYEEAIKYGATSVVCAVTTPGCDESETAPQCDGAECTPETGNMTGATRDGVDYRIENTGSDCDEFDEVFFGNEDDGYTLNVHCNPWADGSDSLRVIIIPVVDEFGSGSSDDLEIQSFALLFLEGYDAGKCKGNECEIKGRFIKSDVTVSGLAGTYDEDAPMQTVKLSE